MARSNTYTYTMNRDQLIAAAYQLVNVYGMNDTISAVDSAQANILLNLMIKSWEARDVPLWKRKQAYLFTAYNTASYSISSSGTANCTNSYVSTTISSTEAIGQTALSVTSTTGMTAGDYIGIELDDGTRQWTTISVVNSAVLVTVVASLTVAAAAGNTVVSYTSKINRPLRILRGNIRDISNSQLFESQMQAISYDEYFDLPVKSTTGKPNNYFYDKQLDSGVMYLFTTPNNVNWVQAFTYHESIMDMTTATDSFDFPQEWTECLLYNLAAKLGAVKKIPGIDSIKQDAVMLLEQMKNFDSDMEDMTIKIRCRR